MKADHKKSAAEDKKNTEALKIDKITKNKYPVLLTILPILAMLVTVLQGILCHEDWIETAKITVVTLILTGAVTYYIRLFAEDVIKKKFAVMIIVPGYLLSICLLLFVPDPGLANFWMLGGLVIAMLLDNKLGLLFQFNLVFILGITTGVYLQTIIQILIICILLSMLSGALNDKSTFVYAAVIILSVNVTLACAINNFAFEKITDYNYYYSLFSVFAVLAAAFLISVFYRKILRGNTSQEHQLPESAVRPEQEAVRISQVNTSSQEEAAKQPEPQNAVKDTKTAQNDSDRMDLQPQSIHSPGTRTSYEILCDNDNLLLKQLKEFSESLYLHAIRIGDLSGRAAKAVEADELLAKAGGLYHEIGKINGRNYIEESLKLAEDYAFPNELTAILREHNIKYDKPNSVEAAIVMLSDNLVSTIEYIEKTEDRKFTTNKIIENIFQMRLDKGTFDSAGISLKNYKILKEFYMTEFCKNNEV